MIDPTTARLVRSPLFDGQAWGDVAWSQTNGSWRGRIEVTGAVDLRVQLEVQFRPGRPDEPSVVLLVAGGHAWRIDHNQVHEGVLSTHIQGLGMTEILDPLELGSPPMGEDLGLSYLERTMRSSAKYLNIGTKGVTWTSPEGSEQ